MGIYRSIATMSLAALVGTASGCAEFSTYRYQNIIVMVKPEKRYDRIWSDENLEFRFEIGAKKILTYVRNKSDVDAVIDWGGAEFVGPAGAKAKLDDLNTVFYQDPPDHVLKHVVHGETTMNILVPSGKAVKSEEQWMWMLEPMFDLETDAALENVGKRISITLPVVQGGFARKYLFEFEVVSVQPHRRFNPL